MHDIRSGAVVAGTAALSRMREHEKIQAMLDDAVLSPDLRPDRRRAAGRPAGLRDARRVLVTGASGFLGRWLVKELLAESEATLACIVRDAAGADAATRLRASLAAAGLDRATFDARIRVVRGDLAQPGLGMTARTVEDLASDIDAICHAGAVVNWVLPYRALKAANVGATRELLTFAARHCLPFHFVSSLSVCYSSPAPAEAIGPDFDPLEHLNGLHLGYAQSKAVAESLVLEAGRRGLPFTIYRPSLISGHRLTGAFNDGDILARVVSGCVRMGTAPDLDWPLDCLPVDVAAQHVVALSHVRGTHHLLHDRPRDWRECALWMRLRGYRVRLIPYHAWLSQMDRETARDRSHPLRPLRSFLLARPSTVDRRTLPEVLLASSRRFAAPARTAPQLDAPLLHTYFDAFARRRIVPEAPSVTRAPIAGHLTMGFFARALKMTVDSAQFIDQLSDHSIISELTAWRSGQPSGLFRYRLACEGQERTVVVKIKPADRETIAVGEALAQLCDDRLACAYTRFSGRLGLAGSHEREIGVYGQRDPRFVRHAPRALGSDSDAEHGAWTLILEHIGNARLQNAASRPHLWTTADIDCVSAGLASLHAIWYDREAALRALPWMGYVPEPGDISEMSDLWMALADHAAPYFASWSDTSMRSIQRRLIWSIDRWWPALAAQPRTLVHNDFNPRNICLRADGGRWRLLAYDWELATIAAPQRDLAELLCFVLPPSSSDADIDFWIGRHRMQLEEATGHHVDTRVWTAGFRAALYDLMINRLPMYALVHRVRRQSFLPRVVQTWRRLYERFPLEYDA
ncbi:MAG TPA: thioester reductase domain-containing protein [Vicinamibacterales bacterium]|nr:thioester reductase domain-containing protein [Vicinamibacterales bacterium]